jgi:glycosyltransferase involved in cell wall biosynthesis
MRITFLTNAYVYVPSGGIRVVYEHANRLVARGHEVSVVQPRRLKYLPPAEKTTAYYRARGWVDRLRMMVVKPTMYWQPVDKRVKSLFVPSSDASHIPDADAIFATGWHTVRSVLECPKTKGEKFYLIQHYEKWMGPKDLVDETWRAPLHKAVVSKWLEEVGRELGCRDIAYVPNAIDHTRYRLVRPIEGRRPRVAMAFSKTPFKGGADGIEALSIARQKYPGLEVVLFGQTSLRPRIPQWIEYHCNPPQDFIIREIYNQSSIFLCSSWSEGYALPPAEAAACGCAVVATDNGGIRDYIEHGITGLLSAPKDPESLAENLCLLLGNDNLRIQMANACRNFVAGLSWERSTSLLEDLLRSHVPSACYSENKI